VEAGKQQQQAALAFVQAQKDGAMVEDVAIAINQAVLLNLGDSLELAGLAEIGKKVRTDILENFAEKAKLDESRKLIIAGHWEAGEDILGLLVDSKKDEFPKGINPEIWGHLCRNAIASELKDVPKLFLIESQSLPRSGHHYLKNLLSSANGECFSYCEGYQEPGCCKSSPCRVEAYWNNAREHRQHHVRLTKSHDFNLEQPTLKLPAGALRIVQVRQPYDMILSWLELHQIEANTSLLEKRGISANRIYLYHESQLIEEAWRIIDQDGDTSEINAAKDWLAAKKNYIICFINKWAPLCKPWSAEASKGVGSYLLRYEDLGLAGESLSTIDNGCDSSKAIIRFSPKKPGTIQRKSNRVTDLLNELKSEVAKADREIISKTKEWSKLLKYHPHAVPQEST